MRLKEMEETIHSVSAAVRAHFKSAHDAVMAYNDSKILVSHQGMFSQELVGSLSNSVEELLISKGDKKIVIKRMFSILLEGLQNIRLHGERDGEGKQLAYLIIGISEDRYTLNMANMILATETEKITAYLDEINAYPFDELKAKYMDILSNEFISAKGGAGLGLITTRIKSGPLGYEFQRLNETHDLFVLKVTLPRN